jgi:hypothetical protein
LSAAVEIIGYLCVWLLTRKAAARSSPLLAATKIDAIVLAPDNYYARFNLNGVQARLGQELAALGRAHGVELSFGFQAFPDTLAQAPVSDEAVAILLGRRRRLYPC